MTAPNTTNNVTVRKLADVAEGMWNKSKNAFVNASGDTMTGRLTMENSPLNQVITGTGTTAKTAGSPTKYYPAKWTFDLGIATPNAGDRIVIKLPCAGHDYGIWMSTDNGTTYFPVATQTTTSRLGTRYPSGAYICVVFETYVSGSTNSGAVNDVYPVDGGTSRISPRIGCWRVLNDYDSGNTYERTYLYSVKYYAGPTGIKNKTLICLDKAGTFSMLTSAGSGQGSDKTINTDGKFKLDAIILFYTGNDTAANALAASNSAGYVVYPSCDARYSYNPSGAMVANKPLYIECTVDDDGFWSPTTKCITQTLETGKYYIFLGLICNDSSYTFALAPQHPLYYYDGTNLTERPNKVESSQTNGNIKINGTETNVYTHPTDAGNKHIPAGGSSGQFLGWDSAGTAKWVSNPNTDIKVKATAKTDDANYKILATASASPTTGAATEAVYDTDITLNPSTNTISANVSGTAASAGKLTTARTTYVTLGTASTSTTRDWSGTTTIPVSGTLGLGNGGTGATSAAGARTNLDVYSKSETESLLNGKVVVVTQLPATGESGVTYYVKDTSSSAVDKYDEYIWAKDAGASTESWIHVGEKSIDLSNYVNALSTSGSGPLVASLSKSGNTLTATMGTISIDDLSDWATDTDVTVSSVTYHTWWPVAPTSSNQVYGLSIYNGRLYRIYNNKGTYSAQAYDTNTTYTNKSLGQGYGTCATDAATAAKIVSMSDYVLATGGIVTVKFTNALCASATMNVNGKGAKPIYIKGAAVNANNAATVSAGDTAYFMYDGTAYHLLGTDRAATNPIVNISRSGTTFTATRLDGSTFNFTQQDNNTTYTQAKLGQGYGTCTTAEATAAKSVTLTGYELEPNGVVAVKFTNGLCASATMSINGKTATPIYINGAAVTTTSCKEVLAGDLAFFIYDGSHYQFICTDRISKNGITGLSISGRTITYTRADGSTGTLTTQDTTYTFDGVYNSSSNKAATVSTVTNAVNALDVDDITGFGAGKTLATLTETDGKIAATFQNISITKSQVSDFSHSHGNITNDGKVGTTADYVVVTTTGGAVTATSLATSSPSTSGNTLEFIDTVSQNSKGKISATKKKVTIDDTYSSTGTNPVSGKAIAAALGTLDVTEVGGDGKYIKAIKETDGKITATVETMDTTPTAGSTKAVTSGGIKTALDGKASTALDNVTAKSLANLYAITDGYAAHSNKENAYGLLATIDYSNHPGYTDTNAVFELYDKQSNQVFTGKRYLVVNIRNNASSSGASGTYVYKVTELIQAPVWEKLSLKVYRTDNTNIRIYSLGAGTGYYGSMVCKLVSCTGYGGDSKYTKITMHQGGATSTVPDGTEIPITIVTEDYSTIPSTYRSIIQDVSKGSNLVVNGSGRMSSNYNFSGFTYLPTICYNGSAGSFGFDGTNGSNEFISCDFNKKIVFSADVKNLVAQPSNCVHRIYVAEYDIDKKAVQAHNVMFGVGTLTELAQDLNPGDTVVHLADLSNANWLSATAHHRGLIFWNYQNSYGYLYPPETYSRNVYPNPDGNPLWDAANVNVSAGTITLNSAWTGPAIPAGTKVSRRSGGSAYPYPATITTGDTEWHSLKGYAKGIVAPGTSERVSTKFSQGTAFIKVGIYPSNLSNTDSVTGKRAVVTNFFVYEEQDINDGFGTLPVNRGGTGATTKQAAEYAINGNIQASTAAMADDNRIVFSRIDTQSAQNGVFIYKTGSTMWNYFKGKMSSDTGVNISGNAATATKATQDSDGNAINTTYLKELYQAEYGVSTFADIYAAVTAKKTVYCKVPGATAGSARMAFLAYVNVSNPPTSSSNIEFQYYRSNSSGTGDSVFVYTITNNNNTWTTVERAADTKVTATAKTTDNVNYKILATASASPTSGAVTEAVYDPDITLNPSTNTISANISGNAATASAAQTGSALETAINNKATKPIRLTFTLPVAPSGGTSAVKYVKITSTGSDYRQWLCSYNGNVSSYHSTWLFRSYSTGESSRDSVTLIKNGTASERQWYCAGANTWYVKFTNTVTTSSYQIVFNVASIDTSALPTLEAVDTMPDTATEITVYGVTKAEQLRTARQLAVSLSNTTTNTTFDGSANVTNIKTTGTLGIANGGTGATTKKAAEFAICGNMAQATAAMADNFQFVFSRVGTDQNATNGVFIYRTASTIWDYMKGKIKADSHCLDSDDAIDIWNSI